MTEQEMQRAQPDNADWMNAVGRLAGGIAHDFNNLLMIVSARARFALDELPEGHPVRPHIEQIAEAGSKAAHLTRQLLAFGRKQNLEPQTASLSELVRELAPQLRRELGGRIELDLALSGELWPAMVDRAQMTLVLSNLASNARDAMPDGGRLTIATENVELGADASALAPGAYVRLRVADTGHGMDETTRARAFEPFFTTKVPGKGTGLGLSVVHGIVKQSSGDTVVTSAPGAGATIDIYLPRAGGAAPSLSADLPVSALAAAGTRGRPEAGGPPILVCDDEEPVRTAIATVLRRLGFTVLEARNGPEALLLCELQQTPLRLLVTDLEMPEMSGEVLAEQLVTRYPGLGVLYVSGYIDDTLAPLSDPELGVAFLEKPFTPAVLARHVTALMEGAAA